MLNPGKNKVTVMISVFTVMMGATAMLGWLLHMQILTTIIPGYPTMKFNTSIGLIVAGFSLFFSLQKDLSFAKRLSRFLSLILVLLGNIELSEFILNYKSGIDELIVLDQFDLMGGVAGRMAMGTALSFLLSGLGLYLRFSEKLKLQEIGQYCLHIVTLASALAIIGYLFKVPSFYTFLLLNSMALFTAITFFIFSIGAAYSHGNLGLAALFTGRQTGSLMARKFFPRLLASVILLAYLRISYNKHFPLSENLGIALFGLAVILIGLFLIWNTVFWLNNLDKQRAAAEEALSKLNKNLERTIELRTAELNVSLEKLRNSEDSFRFLVEGVSDYGIFMIDPHGRILNWNKGAQNIKGYKAEEVIGEHISIFYTPEEMKRGEPEYNLEIALQRGNYESEGLRVRKDGSRFWANVVLTPLYDKDGLKGFSKITRDISAKKNAEEVSAREAALVQTIPDAIVYGKKKDLIITSMNKAAEELFGIAAADARGKKIDEIVRVQIVGVNREDVQKDLWGGNGFWRGEIIFTTMDGRRLNILATVKAMQNYLGEENTWLGIYSDITELKTTEERLELAFEGTAGGLWDWNIKKDKRWWSPRYFELLGYSTNEVNPSFETLKELVHPQDAPVLFGHIQRNLVPPGRFEQEVRYKTKIGNYKWFRAIGKTRFGENGEPLRMVGSIIDIDEKKRGEQLINEQAELIKMLPDGIIYGDLNNRIIRLNRGAEEMFETTNDDAIGRPIEDVVSFSMTGGRDANRKELIEKGFLRAEMEFINRKGRKITVLASVKLLTDVAGNGPGWLCIYTDTTPLRLNEELKTALNKLEANNQYLEQLAYISAHDIKAPIIALEGLADVLIQSNAVKTEYAEVMNMFINKIHQMKRTNHSLNNILKLRKNLLLKEDVKDQSVSLQLILDDVKATLLTEINHAGALVVTELSDLAEVQFPYVHFKSIFYNLTANAIKYRHVDRPLVIMVKARKLNDKGYEFIIEDNGLGIDLVRNKDKLFGIFKRFHNHIEGTGVGLHIVKSIVEAYGGSIVVESVVGSGTVFKIIFDQFTGG